MKSEERKVSSFETLMGYAQGRVARVDGTTEEIRIRQLPVDEYLKLMELLADEQGQIELYCLRQQPLSPALSPSDGAREKQPREQEWEVVPKGWARGLTVESHMAVIEQAEALNGDFFDRWLRRLKKKVEIVRPGLFEDLAKAVGLGSNLPSSSPKSPRPAA